MDPYKFDKGCPMEGQPKLCVHCAKHNNAKEDAKGKNVSLVCLRAHNIFQRTINNMCERNLPSTLQSEKRERNIP
jgi:hypothetical protein